MIIFFAILAIVFVYTSWMGICSNITFRQRMEMLDSVKPGNSMAIEILNEISRVTYHQHMYALMKLQDPMKLYDQELLKGVKNETSV